MNAEVTWETPINRPTSMIVVSSSSTTAITTAKMMPRKSMTGMTYRRTSPAVVARDGPDATVATGVAGVAGAAAGTVVGTSAADDGVDATAVLAVLDVTVTVSLRCM